MNNIQSKIINNQLYFKINIDDEEILVSFKYLINKINCIFKADLDNKRVLLGEEDGLYLYVPSSMEEFKVIHTIVSKFLREGYILRLYSDRLYLDENYSIKVNVVGDKVYIAEVVDKNLLKIYFKDKILKDTFKVEVIEQHNTTPIDTQEYPYRDRQVLNSLESNLEFKQIFEIFYDKDVYEFLNGKLSRITPVSKIKLKDEYIKNVFVELESEILKHFIKINEMKYELTLVNNEFLLDIDSIKKLYLL